MLVACPYAPAIATALRRPVHEVEHATEAPMRLQTNGEVTMEELSGDLKQIRDVLIRCAQDGHTITYEDLGNEIGRPPQGPWKDDLDAIKRYEEAHSRPDVTLVVVEKKSGLPSIYKDEALKRSDRERVEEYENDRERLFKEWGKVS